MDSAQQHYLMLQILIGSAWIDCHLEPEEVTFLEKVLTRFNLGSDRELQALLKTPVPSVQTEQWLVVYLRDSPDSERLKLLAAIGNLLISDDVVSSVEHDLLDDFHDLMAKIPAPPEPTSFIDAAPKVLRNIGQFFRRVVKLS